MVQTMINYDKAELEENTKWPMLPAESESILTANTINTCPHHEHGRVLERFAAAGMRAVERCVIAVCEHVALQLNSKHKLCVAAWMLAREHLSFFHAPVFLVVVHALTRRVKSEERHHTATMTQRSTANFGTDRYTTN